MQVECCLCQDSFGVPFAEDALCPGMAWVCTECANTNAASSASGGGDTASASSFKSAAAEAVKEKPTPALHAKNDDDDARAEPEPAGAVLGTVQVYNVHHKSARGRPSVLQLAGGSLRQPIEHKDANGANTSTQVTLPLGSAAPAATAVDAAETEVEFNERVRKIEDFLWQAKVTVKELKARLRGAKLPLGGKKADLIARWARFDALGGSREESDLSLSDEAPDGGGEGEAAPEVLTPSGSSRRPLPLQLRRRPLQLKLRPHGVTTPHRATRAAPTTSGSTATRTTSRAAATATV